MKFEIEYLEKLAKIVSANELSELSLEEGEKAIIIKKEKQFVATQAIPSTQPPVLTQTPTPVATSVQPTETQKSMTAAEAPKGLHITSPMVGTFYRAPSPGAAPFTEVGKTVSVGQVVCIIEAMKLMNEIESEVAGKVVEICVQDGQPVEYGQVLMVVEQ